MWISSSKWSQDATCSILLGSGRTWKIFWAAMLTSSLTEESVHTCGSASSLRLFRCEGRAGTLVHAIDAIDAIQRYTVDGREAFFSDGKTQDAVIRNIEILGQAVKGISDDTRALEPAIPWRKIAGMRDKLIHEYFGVELLGLVWDVVEDELPVLRPQLDRLSKRLEEGSESPSTS